MSKLREEGHITEKGKICPKCKQKDTIQYWKSEGNNQDLFGRKIDNWKRIRPTCRNCKSVFSKGTLFTVAR